MKPYNPRIESYFDARRGVFIITKALLRKKIRAEAKATATPDMSITQWVEKINSLGNHKANVESVIMIGHPPSYTKRTRVVAIESLGDTPAIFY